MSNPVFNTHEFLHALSFANVDLIESKCRFQEYIEKYPKDYTAYTHLAVILVMLRELDMAQDILELVSLLVLNNNSFRENAYLYNRYIGNYNFARIKLLCYQDKMQELYDEYIVPNYQIDKFGMMDINMLRDNQQLSSIRLWAIRVYCLKKLGKLDVESRNASHYLLRQIIDYQESDFLYHIRKHQSAFNLDAAVTNPVVFSDDFPMPEVIDVIKDIIPNEKVVFSGFLEDLYTFRYDECGRVNGKITDFFQVVTIHGTNQLITIYPNSDCQCFPYTDLNYLNKTQKQSKIKVRSQIDKFNARYQNK